MSKRKSRGTKRQRHLGQSAKVNNSKSDVSVDAVRTSTNRLMFINVVIVWLAIASYFYTERNMNAYDMLSPMSKSIVDYLLKLLSIVGIMQSFMIGAIALLSQEGEGGAYLKIIRNLYRSEVIISVITLTITIAPPLYLSGFTNKIATLLNSYFPNLGQKVSTAISYLVTIIFSGVLGNFAYDVLKKSATKLIVNIKEKR